jgi:hypothetical protein
VDAMAEWEIWGSCGMTIAGLFLGGHKCRDLFALSCVLRCKISSPEFLLALSFYDSKVMDPYEFS